MGAKLSGQLKGGQSFFERLFFCPGCGCAHGFRGPQWPMPPGLTDEEKEWFQNKWQWNGSLDAPTLWPSVHIQEKMGIGADNKPIYETICHSWVKDGKIHFLSECKHSLKGQIIELPDF